ncbi:N-acetyltransferase [Salipiger sp. IMCC34102]|uniref:GNAT family N-acetyltransferase n=1 Tax=Salipiger sp. IMCC34102 TaxID=2510647 RepID=UPI00101D02F1|nr:GNAT family N-acetyltransferase [Salipiger sp. IMCC34102]RYH03988.1 N-acetyltransferase [Salipiger sp. IMCC34102]
MTTTLQTGRLRLRRPTAADWPAWRDFMLSDRSAAISDTRDEGRIWRAFAAEIGHWDIFGYGMWAVTRTGDDTAVALVGPWTPPDWPEAEIGWMVLDPAAEGTGIASEAARAALDHAFGTLGWTTAVSYIAPGNDRSVALAERLGARLDPDATGPKADTLVYRHPLPEDRP